jgi:hypothetical protein
VVRGVADLIDGHTDNRGRFCCSRCGGTETVLAAPRRPGSDAEGDEWIKGVVPIDTKFADAAYAPFVFLTAEAPDGDVTGIAFRYYRTRRSNGGKAKRGRRPNGGPVLAQSHLLALVGRLAAIGVVSPRHWQDLIRAADAKAR